MNDKINELYNNLDAKDKIINEQALEIARLKETLLDIKKLQDNYLEEIYKGNLDLRLASSTLCKIDNIVNKALGDKENE